MAVNALAGTAFGRRVDAAPLIDDAPQSQLIFLSRSSFVSCCTEPGATSNGNLLPLFAFALADNYRQVRTR